MIIILKTITRTVFMVLPSWLRVEICSRDITAVITKMGTALAGMPR